jgi:SAM-dependent methyltransferase
MTNIQPRPVEVERVADSAIPAPFRTALGELERFSKLPRHQIKVLDWGCGEGGLVHLLGRLGYDAYGCDLKIPRSARCGTASGSLAPRLLIYKPGHQLPLPSSYFHAVVSDQVLEHVEDLEAVAAEISRLAKPAGLAVHRFPCRYRIIEPHLLMPLVHWLPKNRLRYWYIMLMVSLGVGPRWPSTCGLDLSECAQRYFAYSVGKTYFRSASSVSAVMRRYGMQELRLAPAKNTSRRMVHWLRPAYRSAVLQFEKAVDG